MKKGTSKLPAITLDQALKNLKDTPELSVIVQTIDNLNQKTDISNVVNLGTDEAFALKDTNGEIRAFKQRVHLSLSDKTLIQPTSNGDCVISAQGYEVWAEASGSSVIFPKEVMVENNMMPNPFIERDPTNRRILAVTARAVAFRFSSKGIPQVSDWTTIFDTPSYRMIDLLAKAKKCPQAFKLLPGTMQPDEDGTWASYPFDESTNLWIETSHEEALTWFSQILNREKKAMDFAQTFAKRNALKHLSGLQKAPGKDWELSVLCWRPTSGNIVKWDSSTYVQLQGQVARLIDDGGEAFQTRQIESKAGSERVEDESAQEGEIDPEDSPIDVEHTVEKEEKTPIETTDEKKLSPKDKKTMLQYAATVSQMPDEAKAAMVELKVPEGVLIDPKTARKIMKKINSMVDEANA